MPLDQEPAALRIDFNAVRDLLVAEHASKPFRCANREGKRPNAAQTLSAGDTAI